MANGLTTMRVLLLIPFAVLMTRADARSAALAGVTLTAAIATDLLDGFFARRHGTVTGAGALFDHTADCCFVTAGLAAGATRGAFPWALPPLVAAAFLQYVLDSYLGHSGLALRPSALGRWNGILYFTPLVGDVLVRLGLGTLRPVVTGLAWALVVTTVISMGDRLRVLRLARGTARGSLGGGTGDRPRR